MRTRFERLRDKRDDLDDDLYQYRRLLKPSQRRAWERRLAKLNAKIEKLRGYEP